MEAMLRMRLQCPYNEKERGPRTELKKTLRHRERKQSPPRRPRKNMQGCRRNRTRKEDTGQRQLSGQGGYGPTLLT